jgi:hypothetical protein
MVAPQREWKHIQRRLRKIPVDSVAPFFAATDVNGMWCMVAGELVHVLMERKPGETAWDDDLEYAQVVRYVQTQPERIHASLESAQDLVRSRFGRTGSA